MAHPQLEYNQHRERQIAYGRWQPWADAEKVRQHVRLLRDNRGTWDAIAKAAGVSSMTVWSALNQGGQIKADTGRKLLAVTPRDLGLLRVHSGGSMWRLRSLVAMGHSNLRMSRALGVTNDVINRLVAGEVETVTWELRRDIIALWSAWWDKRPPARNPYEKTAATKARRKARENRWPTPANLDEDSLEIPGYMPVRSWRPATGVGVADDFSLGRQEAAS
jgi:hypothetical protein